MRRHIILSTLAAAIVGGPALAEAISYNYVQADLLGTSLGDSGDSTNGSGFAIRGSAGFASNLFATADISTNKYTESGLSLRFTDGSLGTGIHVPLSSSLDFFGIASFERVAVKFTESGNGSTTYRYSGWGLGTGVRGRIGEKGEWNAGLKYRDVGSLQSIIGFTVGGRYHFTPDFSVGFDVTGQKYDKDTLDEKESIGSVNFRYAFNGR
jgi:hypothetical protein